jgi:hypothetical protein
MYMQRSALLRQCALADFLIYGLSQDWSLVFPA